MKSGSRTNAIDAAAASWAIRSSGPMTLADKAALDAWLEADSRHRGAYLRACAAWHDSERLLAMAKGRMKPARRTGFQPGRLRYAAAAVVLLALSGLLALQLHARLSGNYVTRAGEVTRVALEDGSTIVLNSNTAVRVRYRSGRRDIQLVRGEATFQVRHDPVRPFIVRAGEVQARAVGTEFAVRRANDEVSVTVIEGVVEVHRANVAGADASQTLRRNDDLVVPGRQEPARRVALTPRQVSLAMAWRDGYIVFDGERLDAAAEEMNRHSSLQLQIADPALAGRQLVGVFRVGDSRTFARTVVSAFDATLREEGGQLILSGPQRQRETTRQVE